MVASKKPPVVQEEQKTPVLEQLLTVPQAAEKLNSSPDFIYDLIKAGQLKIVPTGRKYSIRPVTLALWIQDNEQVISN